MINLRVDLITLVTAMALQQSLEHNSLLFAQVVKTVFSICMHFFIPDEFQKLTSLETQLKDVWGLNFEVTFIGNWYFMLYSNIIQDHRHFFTFTLISLYVPENTTHVYN